MKYVIIEQEEEGEALISRIKAKDYNSVYNKIAESVIFTEGNNIIVLTEEAFYNMCMMGVKK